MKRDEWCVLVCVECVCVMAKTMFCGGLFLRLVTVKVGVIFGLGEFDMLISAIETWLIFHSWRLVIVEIGVEV